MHERREESEKISCLIHWTRGANGIFVISQDNHPLRSGIQERKIQESQLCG
jgi:hypothetical protein